MSCNWEISSYYRTGSEGINVWTCTRCKETVWLWDSEGKPDACRTAFTELKGEK